MSEMNSNSWQWRVLQLSNETKSTILKVGEQYVPYKKISGRWYVPRGLHHP